MKMGNKSGITIYCGVKIPDERKYEIVEKLLGICNMKEEIDSEEDFYDFYCNEKIAKTEYFLSHDNYNDIFIVLKEAFPSMSKIENITEILPNAEEVAKFDSWISTALGPEFQYSIYTVPYW